MRKAFGKTSLLSCGMHVCVASREVWRASTGFGVCVGVSGAGVRSTFIFAHESCPKRCDMRARPTSAKELSMSGVLLRQDLRTCVPGFLDGRAPPRDPTHPTHWATRAPGGLRAGFAVKIGFSVDAQCASTGLLVRVLCCCVPKQGGLFEPGTATACATTRGCAPPQLSGA